VQNSGKRAGDEVVQLYVKHLGVVRELQGFERISLRPAERKTVEFALESRSPGDIEILVGGLNGRCRITGAR
jgi:beta-glucosidase